MKSSRRSLTLLLVVSFLLAAVSLVSAQEGEVTAAVERFLYVRALPDVKAYDYGRIDPGTQLTLVGRSDDLSWVKLQLEDGTLGWARTDSVVADGDIEGLPVVDVTRSHAVVTRFVTLRSGPNLNAMPVQRLGQGTMVELVAASGNWLYAVAEDGAAGWAVSRGLQFTRAGGDDQPSIPELPEVNAAVQGFAYVRVLPEVSAHSYDRLDPGTPVTIVGRNDAGNWVQVETLDGQTAWATARAFWIDGDVTEFPVTAPEAGTALVTRFAVLRAAPESDAPEVARLDAGQAVDILLASGDRVYVAAEDGTEGWALMNALSFAGGELPRMLATNATVTADMTVNLRAAPSIEAGLRGSAQVGERLAGVGVSADG
ncbi:MAG: hypothetical protein JXN59_02425, partial [Anaerolineae bacterium]|nr:hypothetical protein [Anaerolineae bacterium]